MKTDSNFRILETDKGFVIQEGSIKNSFFGDVLFEWKTISKYRGSEDIFYFSTFESALNELRTEITFKTIENSKNL